MYLGALLDKEGEATKDIQQRFSKTRKKLSTGYEEFGTLAKLAGRPKLNCSKRSLETHKTKSKKLYAFQYNTDNKVAPDHLKPRNPGDYSSEQSK